MLRQAIGRMACASVICVAVTAWAQPGIITNVAGVRALNATEAAKAHPVQLRGVVIDQAEPDQRAVMVADDTGGLYILANSTLFSTSRRGDLLEINGVTDPGEFAPIVKVARIRKLGTAALPEPRRTTYHELTTGIMDAQWVEISGVVQSTTLIPGQPPIQRTLVWVQGNLVHVRTRGTQDANLMEDAEVRVRALCFYQVNPRRQLLNPVLSVPQGIPIHIEKPAPADPFSLPLRSAESLLRFSPETQSGHRVHVRGVVMHSPGDTSVWIRDATAGLRLQVRTNITLTPGEFIDVLGFPKFGGATPILEECVLQKLGVTNPPAPFALTNPASAFDHEANLVSLDAMLTEVAPLLEGVALTLTAGGTVFKAMLKPAPAPMKAPDWKAGSRVRVTGICSVSYDDMRPVMGLWHPQSFQLLLRSPADLTVLQAPPWWTPEHIAYLLTAATAVLMLAVGTVTWMARRRLREQGRQRAMAEAEFAAILSERNRVAREIHDTLAQGLTATSFQLRLARKHATASGTELNQHLDAAQELVRGSLAEARNSIWNMRSQVLETHDLPGALENILKQMADGSDCETTFKVTGQVRRFAPVLENNLLRVGQEAITNAVRHAKARRIELQLDFAEKQFRLSVRDDGRGFDSRTPAKSDGSFGLVGMQERAKEMNGDFQVRSSLGAGTEITLTIPLAAQ
jgi:signal transduction histidine kinase